MENLIIPLQRTLPYKKGYKYQLAEPVSFLIPSLVQYAPITSSYYFLKEDGTLHIKAGYTWDGFSIRSCLIKDVLHQMLCKESIPVDYAKTVKAILKDQNIQDGLWNWCTNLFSTKNKPKKVFYAP